MPKKEKAPAAVEYRVLHIFAHAGKRYGPWNAHEVARLPAAIRERLEARRRIEIVPTPTDEGGVAPLNEE